MAIALHICSLSPAAGKTTLAAGLALHFNRRRLAASYLGISAAPTPAAEGAVQLMEDLLGGTASQPRADAIFISPDRDISREAAHSAFAALSASSEVVIVEQGGALADRDGGKLARFALQALPGPVLLVVRYRVGLRADEVVRQLQGVAGLAGIVVTVVPPNQMAEGEQLARSIADGLGAPSLGVLPQERGLFAVVVAEIAEHLQAEILSGEDRLDRLVESVLIGARSFGDATAYYNRRQNKALVTTGDRPDVMLAALETSCACIVATGGVMPQHIVMMRAEGREVPILLVPDDTRRTVDRLDALFSASRFQQVQKAEALDRFLAGRFNFAAMETAAGLVPQPR